MLKKYGAFECGIWIQRHLIHKIDESVVVEVDHRFMLGISKDETS